MLVQSIINLFSSSNKDRHSSLSPLKLDKRKQADSSKTNIDDDEVLVIRLRDKNLDGHQQSNSAKIPCSSKFPLGQQRSDESRRHLDRERKPPISRSRLRSILPSLSSSKPLTHQPTQPTQIKISLPSETFPINHQSNIDSNIPSKSFSPLVSSSLSKALSNTFSKSLSNFHLNPTATISQKSRLGKKQQASISTNRDSLSPISISGDHKLKNDRRTLDSNVEINLAVNENLTSNSYSSRNIVIKQKNPICEVENLNNRTSLKIFNSNPTELTVKLNPPTSKMNSSYHFDTLTRSLTTPITSSRLDSQLSALQLSERCHSDLVALHPLDPHELDLEEINDNTECFSGSRFIIHTEDDDHSVQAELEKDLFDFNRNNLPGE